MAAIELRNVTKKFATADGGTYTALKDLSLTVEDGQFCAVVGPHGLRQVHDADPGLGARASLARRGPRPRRAGPGHRHRHRLRLPAGRGVPVALGPRQRRGRARSTAGGQPVRGHRAGAGLAAPGRPERLRGPLPAPAVRRDAQAGRAGADAHQPAADPADGRAVQRARRADPGDHVHRAAAPVGPDQAGGRLRHARPRGGHRPRRQGRRHHRRAGDGQGGVRDRPAAAARRPGDPLRPTLHPASTSRSGRRCAPRSPRPTRGRPGRWRWRRDRHPHGHQRRCRRPGRAVPRRGSGRPRYVAQAPRGAAAPRAGRGPRRHRGRPARRAGSSASTPSSSTRSSGASPRACGPTSTPGSPSAPARARSAPRSSSPSRRPSSAS